MTKAAKYLDQLMSCDMGPIEDDLIGKCTNDCLRALVLTTDLVEDPSIRLRIMMQVVINMCAAPTAGLGIMGHPAADAHTAVAGEIAEVLTRASKVVVDDPALVEALDGARERDRAGRGGVRWTR